MNSTKINWAYLSENSRAIPLLKKYADLIRWDYLPDNTNRKAIPLLKKQINEDPDSIDWEKLSRNPLAIELLDKNKDRIVWSALSSNPGAIELLKERIEYEGKLKKKDYTILSNKIDWGILAANPCIFMIDDK
uniref:DUF4116 domain-containing protein n=1 Tax=viral metagenome TaxID=1070528 RepID=A0A6C0LDW4_9ZZZZ